MNEEEVIQDSPEQVDEAISEDVKTPSHSEPVKTEEKVVPYSRFKEVNDKLKELSNQPKNVVKEALDVEDYINISSAFEGLDAREKERLAKEHKLSGRPLKELRDDEDFKLWQKAYKDKVEKDRLTLEPSTTMSEVDKPRSFADKLKSASSIAEKEELLKKAGLYKEVKKRSDTVIIGGRR